MTIFGYSLGRSLKDYGWAVALAVALFAVALVYSKVPERIGLPLPTSQDIVPATGVEGYVGSETFCKDSRTKVTVAITPGVGTYYSMRRILNEIPELLIVVVPFDPTQEIGGTHWANSNVGQASQPAIVDEATLRCAERKGQPIQ